MIDQKTVEQIHDKLIEQFGGGKGLRDKGALLSALARPYATFDQHD
jgi:death on curing protein